MTPTTGTRQAEPPGGGARADQCRGREAGEIAPAAPARKGEATGKTPEEVALLVALQLGDKIAFQGSNTL